MSFPVRTLTREWVERRCIPEPNSGCWLWTGAVTDRGYGKANHGGTWKTAHRISWTVFNGPIPVGGFVLHRCDLPLCVNPKHLVLGDNTANMRDMFSKGRHPRQKLSPQQVAEIRASGESQYALAERYGVAQSLISQIVTNRIWNRADWRAL